MQLREYGIGLALGGALIVAAWRHWLPYSLTETLGFVTGAWCVYLVVKQSIWNFPIGIANNLFFLVLFAQARLFADAGLQIVYLVLGLHGWYAWLYGGQQNRALKLARAGKQVLALTGCAVVVATGILVLVLRWANGAAPLLDAFTTALSLGAQYLLNRKLLENWLLWILADVIYVFLYLARGLQLTALLYAVFLAMCIAGWFSWGRSLREQADEIQPEPVHV